MDNKYVGYLLLGISVLIIIVIFMFNSVLKDITQSLCTTEEHASLCPIIKKTLNQQTYIALGVVSLLVIVGFILALSKPQKEIIFKTKTIEKKSERSELNLKELKPEEKQVLNLIQNNKAIFQAELIEKTGFGKAKMTRIIDRLEGKGLVERKRRGMTNIVVLKE